MIQDENLPYPRAAARLKFDLTLSVTVDLSPGVCGCLPPTLILQTVASMILLPYFLVFGNLHRPSSSSTVEMP